MADAQDSKSCAFGRMGSSPIFPTIALNKKTVRSAEFTLCESGHSQSELCTHRVNSALRTDKHHVRSAEFALCESGHSQSELCTPD